jgi:hypothetical protein
MKLRVALGVPNHFAPKARYAFRVLLAPYDVEIEWCEPKDVLQQGGCYYGSLPIGDIQPSQSVYVISSESSTWEFFQDIEGKQTPKYYQRADDDGAELPILFGNPNHPNKDILAHFLADDLIASAFYWLSDWQEITHKARDSHGRILFKGSLHDRLGLAYRALVDEYGEYLLQFLGHQPEALRRSARVRSIVSHDIDRIKKKTAGIIVRESWDYLILNRLKMPLVQRLKRWIEAMRQFISPSDAYQESISKLLDHSRTYSLPTTFFFKSIIDRHSHDASDYLDHSYFRYLREQVLQQPFEIGYHSGYLAGSRLDVLQKEWEQLNHHVGTQVRIHRSHYLRYDARITSPALQELSFQVDSSIAWADHIGLRAQTSHPYPIFDLVSNRELSILEVPLSVMDTQCFGYMKVSSDQALEHISRLLNTIKRYKGVVVWNFHHHIHDPLDAPDWITILSFAYQQATSFESTSFSDIYKQYRSYYEQ